MPTPAPAEAAGTAAAEAAEPQIEPLSAMPPAGSGSAPDLQGLDMATAVR